MAAFDVALWVDGIGQPEGRAPAEAREAVRRMTYETYVQEKPYGDTIVLDPPAIGRMSEIRVPTLVIIGGLDTPSTRASADLVAAGIAGARRIDLPDVAHMPSLERPEWFNETLLAFLAGVG
jgi:3-oxoadipate enol-lactonase